MIFKLNEKFCIFIDYSVSSFYSDQPSVVDEKTFLLKRNKMNCV